MKLNTPHPWALLFTLIDAFGNHTRQSNATRPPRRIKRTATHSIAAQRIESSSFRLESMNSMRTDEMNTSVTHGNASLAETHSCDGAMASVLLQIVDERNVNRLTHSSVYRNAKRDQSSNDENNIAIHGYLCRSYDARQHA